MMKGIFSRVFLVLMIIVLYLPIFVLAVYSFTDSAKYWGDSWFFA